MARTRPEALRRYYLRKERTAERYGESALALAWRSRRLAETGTALPAGLPARAALLAAGYLALDEVDGAEVIELQRAGLSSADALLVFNRINGVTVPTTYFTSGPQQGEAYDQDEITLLASASRSASFNGDAVEVGDRPTLRLSLAISAISTTLQVQIETRKDSDDTWRTVDAFPVQSTTGTVRKVFSGCDRFVRAVSTLGGASATYQLTGEGV